MIKVINNRKGSRGGGPNMKVVRKIVRIDPEKCDGCGACIPACPEGALQIVNGKATLVKESLCDGLGACIKECPKGAITIEEREAEPFELPSGHVVPSEAARVEPQVGGGIANWPVKLELVNPRAPFFNGRELIVSADCVPFVYRDFISSFRGRVVVSGCPIFGDKSLYRDKLMGVIKHNNVSSVKVVRMEVPCCSGLASIAHEALEKSGKRLEAEELIITIDGKPKAAQPMEVASWR
jgi:ferredoxin